MIPEFEQACWGLDIHFAYLILPKLLYFKNWSDRYGIPDELSEDKYEWEEILEELVWTFTFIYEGYPNPALKYVRDVEIENNTINITYEDDVKYNEAVDLHTRQLASCQQGLNLFAKYYMNLWN